MRCFKCQMTFFTVVQTLFLDYKSEKKLSGEKILRGNRRSFLKE